jgi:drug/metabolite transporter (DMT)-like permease
MGYLPLSVITLLLWGTYTLFANRANAVHGEKVTMAFEAAAFALLAILACGSARNDFGRVTGRSAFDAACMGLMSAGGFYLLLRALRLEPTRVGTITLITGLYPVVTVFAAALAGQQPLTPRSTLGALLTATGIVLVSWRS